MTWLINASQLLPPTVWQFLFYFLYNISKVYFLSTGPHCVSIYNERRVREMAGLDRLGAARWCWMFRAGRGASGYWGRGAARPDRALQPAPARLRGQAARVPRARRGAARALARAPALPPAAPGTACRAPAPAPPAPCAHQATLAGSSYLLSSPLPPLKHHHLSATRTKKTASHTQVVTYSEIIDHPGKNIENEKLIKKYVSCSECLGRSYCWKWLTN